MKDIISLFLTYFVRLGIPLLTIPILSNSLSGEELGLYIYTQSIVAWYVIVVEFGFSYSATRMMASKGGILARNKIANMSSFIKLVIAIILSFVTFSVGKAFFNIDDSGLVYISIAIAVAIAMVPHSVYQTEEKLIEISKSEIVSSISMLLLISLLAQQSLLESAKQVLSIWLIVRVIVLFYLLIKQRDFGYSLTKLNFEVFSETLQSSIGAATFKITSSLYTTGNVLILTSMLPISEVAIFAAVDKFIRAGQGMLGPISTVFFARIVKGKSNIRVLLISQLLVAFIVVIGLFICANIISNWFYSNKFGDISKFIYLYAPVILLIAINNTYGVNGLLADGKNFIFNIGVFLSALINLMFMVILVPLYGINGAIISVLVSELFCGAYMLIGKNMRQEN